MNKRETDMAAHKAQLAQTRGRRALFALLRKRRAPANATIPPQGATGVGGVGTDAVGYEPETDNVTWRAKFF